MPHTVYLTGTTHFGISLDTCFINFFSIMVSEYNKFVSQHIRSAKGATQKDKMRAVAAMWNARKGKGKGLMAPSGRGLRLPGKGICTMHCKGKHKKGCGFWGDVWEGVKSGVKLAGPRLIDYGLKRLGAGAKKGRGAMPLYPGREGASGGRVNRSKQGALADLIHGLGMGKKSKKGWSDGGTYCR